MNGHCSYCDYEPQCAYPYKPCDCCDYRKFVAKPEEVKTAEIIEFPRKEEKPE